MKTLKYVRLICRIPVALIWTLFVHGFFIRIPQLFKPKKRYLGALRLWGRGLAAIMGIRVHLRNSRKGPMGDMIISNHMGFLDVPVLLSYFPAVFIIKMEMRNVFYFGNALAHQGHIFVERGDKSSMHNAADGLKRTLEAGDRVIVFPEARASNGALRLPFHQGSFRVAKEMGKLVEACIIDYLPDRKMLQWDITKPMLPQFFNLLGRRRTHISLEFVPSTLVEGEPRDFANAYHDLIENKLLGYDKEKDKAVKL